MKHPTVPTVNKSHLYRKATVIEMSEDLIQSPGCSGHEEGFVFTGFPEKSFKL